MAESTAGAGLDSSDPLKSVADALETAFQAVKNGSTHGTAAAENALPAARVLSRIWPTRRATRLRSGLSFRR